MIKLICNFARGVIPRNRSLSFIVYVTHVLLMIYIYEMVYAVYILLENPYIQTSIICIYIHIYIFNGRAPLNHLHVVPPGQSCCMRLAKRSEPLLPCRSHLVVQRLWWRALIALPMGVAPRLKSALLWDMVVSPSHRGIAVTQASPHSCKQLLAIQQVCTAALP